MLIRFTILFLLLHSSVFSQKLLQSDIKLGIDVLEETDFEILNSKKILLYSNNSGRSKDGRLTAEILANQTSCTLTGIMVPEHGFYTAIKAGNPVPDDSLFGIPVYSIYGSTKIPGKKALDQCDYVVVDIQEIGVRSYTYISSLVNIMDECAKADKKIIILDRPNPLSGMIVDGGTVRPGKESFVSRIPISYIHGCTIGELAYMVNQEGWLSRAPNGKPRQCDLLVIELHNWKRWMTWEDTGLFWFPTSPHVPTVESVRGIATIGIIGELGIISIGIGTTSPFRYFGSPQFNPITFNESIDTLHFNGIRLEECEFSPFYGMYSGKLCKGYYLTFPLDNLFAPYSTGLKMLLALRDTHPDLFKKSKVSKRGLDMFSKVTGSDRLVQAIFGTTSQAAIETISKEGLSEYLEIRKKYLIYD